jgi:hypothetical protein
MSALFSNQVKELIEALAERTRKENPIFKQAEKGELSKRHLGLYLFNLYILMTKTEENLSDSEKIARNLGLDKLADYNRDKKEMESGKEAWAMKDLEAFEFTDLDLDDFSLTPSMSKLMSYVDQLAAKDPEGYLGYQVFTGYLALLAGPAWLEHLHTKCGVSLQQMQILSKYQSIDEEYNLTQLELLDRLIRQESYQEVLRVIRTTHKMYDDFQSEVANFFSPSEQTEVLA